MARIRTIKPDFFKNEQMSELPAITRLLFIGLFTLADREGRLQDRPKRIKTDIFPYDTVDVDKGLSQLQSAGFITRYEVGELKVIEIKTFTKHQRITGSEAKTVSELPAPPKALIIKEQSEGNTEDEFGNTLETLRTTGKEGKGREGNGVVEDASTETPTLKTENEIAFEKFQAWLNANASNVAKMKEAFTMEEFLKLKSKIDANVIMEICLKMHNWKDLNKKNINANLTFKNWYNRDYGSK